MEPEINTKRGENTQDMDISEMNTIIRKSMKASTYCYFVLENFKMRLKFKVLLWKSLRLRRRQWLCTIIEIIAPCLLFLIMAFIKPKNSDKIVLYEIIPSAMTEQNLYNSFAEHHSLGYFVYTPNTKETEQIMKRVAKYLNISSNNIDAANCEADMIQKFKNKYMINNNITKKEYSNGFGIVFEEVINSNVFKYKIRSTNDVWQTNLLFPPLELLEPMNSTTAYIQEGFLALQLMLDKMFISLNMSDYNMSNIMDYSLKIQPYPYVKFALSSKFQSEFEMIFPLFTVLCFLLMCSQTIKNIVKEKESGVRELMKLMGLKPWMIWSGWLLHNILAYTISITVITYICCFGVYSDKKQLLIYTNPLLLWIFFFFYFIAGNFFCFAFSSMFRHPIIALISGVSAWILSFNLPQIYLKPTTSMFIKVLFMLLPNITLKNGLTTITSLESMEKGLRFSTLFITKDDNSFSLAFVLFMFILDCFLYGFIAWYMDSIMPGKYGITKPLHFLWKRYTNQTVTNVLKLNRKNTNKLYEDPPSGYEVGISIKNLYKQFENCKAVNGVNLNLYKGQITALLGHNGAGKTTMMSIITGLFSPSSGTVELNGNDLFKNINKFRKNIGLCLQHNLLFSYFTTLEHLIFFGMLKGLPLKEAKSDGLKLLKLLDLQQKKNELVNTLSGGMKRKVSLAIALIGNPEILILDEPTSGMDPESRRKTWNLLLSFRGTRTVLITTHYMEEADVLGDRIAIMDHGQVKCYGTPFFLKKKYGTGYNLTIVKGKSCNEPQIVEEIRNIIPEANIQNSISAQMVILLPNENIDKFPELFKMLEMNSKKFCINGMGVSCTTMEEVFLKTKTNIYEDDSENDYYQLILTKSNGCDVDQVTSFIQQYVSECSVMANKQTQLIYELPNKDKSIFGPLFSALEFQKHNNKLRSVKIIHPTMGELYPNPAISHGQGDEPKQLHYNNPSEALLPKHSKEIDLLINQFKVLVEKKVIYTKRKWVMSLSFGLISLMLCILTIKITNNLFSDSTTNNPQRLNVSLNTYKGSNIYYRAGDDSHENLASNFAFVSKKNNATVNKLSPMNYIINDLLEMNYQDLLKYRTNLMITGDFNQTNATIMYNSAIHAPAIAINLYTNALLQKISGDNRSYISTVNEPIIIKKSMNMCDTKNTDNLISFWCAFITLGLLHLIGYFIALPLSERVSGVKHLQMMTKLSPIMYWISCFIWDYFCYIIIVLVSLVAMYLFDSYHIFTGPNEISTLLILMLIYGWSSILYAYVYSFFNRTFFSSMLLFMLINYMTGFFINHVMLLSKDTIMNLNKSNSFNFWNICRCIILMIPPFSFSSCIAGFLEITWENNKCKVCKSPKMVEECRSMEFNTKSYFVIASDENKYGILEETLYLFFSSALYMAILLLFDYKVFARLYQFFLNKIIGTDIGYTDDSIDPNVMDEKNRVNLAKNNISLSEDSPPILLVDDLVKKFSFTSTCVRGISFAVRRGECFGLLGVNGAGKTSTFRMLTGDIFPSRGGAFIQKDKLCNINSDINRHTSMIGYCPQFDAIYEKLTGKETLKLMAILRGISPINVNRQVNKWIKLLDLEEYKDRLSETYSGGNKKKLNTAMALIGDPPLVFLDEPTCGVDPAAQRNLWKLLAANQKQGQAIVLSSHSMNECEALCNRLAIMVDGVIKCIGSVQYLKNLYGQGFTIIVKLRNSENTNVKTLKTNIERQFAPDIMLKDEHKGLLHYQITNPHAMLSEIFGHMKEFKEHNSIIEDYIIGDTTLEQVFITFAKRSAI